MSNPFALENIQGQQPEQAPNPFAIASIKGAQDEQNAKLRMNLQTAVKQNPDQAAKAAQLGKDTGLPPDLVARNLQSIEFQQMVEQADQTLKTSPRLAQALREKRWLAEQSHDDVKTAAELERTLTGTLGDVVVTAVKGAVGLPQAGVGLLNLPTGGYAGKGLKWLGVDFDEAQKILDSMYSPAQQQANFAVNEARGFVDTLGTMLSNPSTIATTVGESLPQMLGGAALGRGLLAMMPKLAPWLAAAIGEGVMTTGSVSESLRAQSDDGLLDAKKTAAALGAGAGTALFGAAGGKLATRMGVGDVDTLLATKGVTAAEAAVARQGFAVAITKAGISEGVFEELPQSVQEQMWQNWANDRPLGEGVGKAAAQGLLAGLATGGGFQAIAETAQRIGESLESEETRRQQAELDAQRLQEAMSLAMQSKLRERNPEAFRELMAEIGDNESVYMDAQVLAQMPPEALAQMSGVNEQLEAALATGSTVELKVADVLTVAPGSGLEQVFVDNIRTDPNALSLADTQQAGQEAEALLNQEAQRVMQQAADAQAAEQARETVKQTVLTQLNEAGRFSPEVNNAYASLVGNFFTVLGGRLGVSAQEAYAKYPLRVAAGQGIQQFQLDDASNAVLSSLDTDADVASLEKSAGKLRTIYKAAGKVKPTFDALMTRVARQVDGDVLLAPLKGTARATAKIKSDYNGDPTKIKDLVRGTVEIRTAGQAQAAVRQILANFRVLPTGQRNLLTPDANPVDGYRDAKFNVDLGNGVIGEVQVNLPQMLAAKKQAHGFYEERSAIERETAGRERTPGEQARIEALNAAMKAIYDAAWAEATSALNSDSEIGAPLRRADSGSNTRGGTTSQAAQENGQPGTLPSETGIPSTSKNSGISGTSDPILAESEVLDQSVSTRLPTGKKSTENALATQLVVDFNTVKRNPTLVEKFAAKLDNILSLRTGRSKDPAKRIESYIEQMVDNLLWLHDQVPAEIRERSKLWYDGARAIVDRWVPKYGNRYSDMQLAAVLAVMSPKMDWFTNVTLGERIVDVWDQRQDFRWTPEMTEAASQTGIAAYPDEFAQIQGRTLGELNDDFLQALWIVAYDRTYNPREFHVVTPEGDFADLSRNDSGRPAKAAWGNGFGPVAKAVAVLKDGSVENVNGLLGGAHKVRNFYNNIFAPNAPDGSITADTHAVAAALLTPLSQSSPEVADNFGAAGSDSQTGISGTYPVYADAYRRAAEKRGILPREMQSITWEAVRGLFSPTFKAKYSKASAEFDQIWKDYHAKRIDLATARQRIVEYSGGIDAPAWYRPDRGVSDQQWSASYAGELLASGRVDGAAGPGAGADAAPRVVFEVAPDPNDAGLTNAWRELTAGQRLNVSDFVARRVVPRVLELVGGNGQTLPQVGSYLDDTNPSFAMKMGAGDPVLAAKVLGYVLAQDSMMVISDQPFEGGSQVGAIEVEIGDSSPAEIDEVYQLLRRITINGEQPIAGQSTVDGKMVILNYSSVPTDELAAAVDEALAKRYNVRMHAVYSAFPEKQEYDYASDQGDTGGNEAAIRQWARDARAEAGSILRAELERLQRNSGELYQSAVGGRAQRAGASDGADGRGAPHSWSGTGIHFSRQRRSSLDGRYFGTGLKGIEQTRLRESTDSRIRERVYFYINEGQGVRPEAGVGGFAHEVKLKNLYNVQGDPLKLFNAGDLNASESRVLDAGYSGYYFPAAANRQGIAIVMGEASRGMQATVVDAPAGQAPAAAAPQVYRRGLLSRELNALDIDAVRAVAPSAAVRAGNFSVNAEELEAARGALAGQGINLPEQVLNQTLQDDMDAQVQFLTERAQTAGFPDVDAWLANDVMGFMQAAEEWRQMNPAEELTQPARGTYNPAKLLMTLNDSADLSTFLHETGHFFLEVMADVASQPGAPAEIAGDMGAVLKWFGVKDLATWNGMTLEQKRRHHERFAEGFEQYLLEGKAPSKELQPLFRKFRNFMVRVYRSLEQFVMGRELNLSDDVRKVFDRLLATDEQIAEAEQYAGMQAQFDATDEAIEQLQARSLRDLKWAVNARNKMIKALQAQAKNLRKAMETKVRAEVEEQPVYKAMRWLREDTKLSIAGLEDLYMGEGDRYALLDWKPLADRKMAGKEGVHPDIAADMFGFANGDALVRAILNAEPIDSVVEGMTDQRMLEEHGDLIDQRAIEEAATEAVHNEARARALATELTAQRGMSNPRADTGRVDARGRPITVNAMLEAAKQFAANLTGRKRIGELKRAAYAHLQAERRAAKAWEAATAKADTQGAVKAKQDQLLNHEVYRSMLEAQRKVDKANAFFAKVFKGNDEKLVDRGYNPDIVAASRAILSAYGLAPRAGKNALEYLELVAKNDPELANVLRPSVEAALVNAKPYDQLTVDELDALQAEIEAMQRLARRSRQMEVDGNLMDIEDAADELKARMEKIGVPLELPGQNSALTPSQERTRWVQFFKAINRRMEQWSEAMGPEFTRLVFGPVKAAADRFRADRNKYRRQYQQILDKVAPALRKGEIAAPELGYTFGKGHNGIGHAELLHAVLHTGNESNKRKLLLGRGWATELEDGTLDTSRWDAFVERMQNEGYLVKAHYDFAQGVWDLLEDMKPLAQQAHRDVFGRYFAEVTADGFETPFGTYRGGYVPAQADPRIVTDAALRKLAEMENENMAYSFPATSRGFTKSRTEYNRPLMLDLRSIGQHIDKVLLFSHMEPAVRDVNRLLRNKGVSQPLSKIDPAAYEGALIPWLNRAARQQVETPIVGDGGVSRALSAFRNRAGLSLMFANLSNTAQQITGFATAAVKVRPSLLLKATAQYLTSPKKTAQFVSEQSIYMKDRMENEIAAINDAIEDILLDPSVYKKAKTWSQKHAYFLQAAFDNVLSPIVWTGAYNQALERGASEADAVKAGDAAVRQTQGSTLPEDVSRIESGPAAARLFTQFLSYFNMMANTNGAELTKISREVGLKKGAGKALFVVTTGMLVPLWVAEAIAISMRGGPEDEDDDGWYLDDWVAQVIGMGTIKGTLAMVPFVGQFANAAINRVNDNPADDRVSLSPAVSLIEAGVGAPVSVYKAIVEDGNKRTAVRDVASALTIATGLPFVAAARPLGYLAGVADDRIEPTSPADAVRGLITGSVSPESRQ